MQLLYECVCLGRAEEPLTQGEAITLQVVPAACNRPEVCVLVYSVCSSARFSAAYFDE